MKQSINKKNKECKHCIVDTNGDRYCGNDKSPYCTDWCEIHENCRYKEEEE